MVTVAVTEAGHPVRIVQVILLPAKLKQIVRVTDAKEPFVLIREPVPRLQVLPEVPPGIAVRRQW